LKKHVETGHFFGIGGLIFIKEYQTAGIAKPRYDLLGFTLEKLLTNNDFL
jgi:hypothetical protein